MPSNVLVSQRLLNKIAKEYIWLVRQKQLKEAEQYLKRLNPTDEFHQLLRQEIKDIINGRSA